jgi:RNA polymerase sigma factor (sigma-70 family)
MRHKRSIERVWERNEQKIRTQVVARLIRKFGIKYMSFDEILQEAYIIFFTNFYERYDTDEQYTAFLYVCMRNFLINAFKKKSCYGKHFTSDPHTIKGMLGLASYTEESPNKDAYLDVWQQIADDQQEDTTKLDEMFEILEKNLDPQSMSLVRMLFQGYNLKEIAVELGLTPSTCTRMRDRIRGIASKVGLKECLVAS